MADTKITALAAIGANPINVATFPIPMVDLLDNSMAASGTTKKVTVNQILGAGGTATLASATISGDLTVRTNKLVVNATGVGAGKTPSYPLDVAGNVSMTGAGTGTRFLALLDETNTYAGSLTIQAGGGSAGFGGGIVLYGHSHATYPGAVWIGRSSTSSGPIMFGDYGTGPGNKFLQLDTGGVCTWYDGAGGTRMTLNSTGLIRGASSADIISTESTTLTNIGNIGAAYGTNTGTYFAIKVGAANGIVELKADARSGAYPPMVFTTGATQRLRLKENGQLRFVPLASDPSGAEAGDVYYNSSSNKLKCYNGTTWNDLF